MFRFLSTARWRSTSITMVFPTSPFPTAPTHHDYTLLLWVITPLESASRPNSTMQSSLLEKKAFAPVHSIPASRSDPPAPSNKKVWLCGFPLVATPTAAQEFVHGRVPILPTPILLSNSRLEA